MPAGGRSKSKKNFGAPAARQNSHFWGFSRGPDLQGCRCHGGISDSVCCRLAIPHFKKDIQRLSHRGCLSGSCQKTRKDIEDIFRFPRDFFGRVTIQAPIREREKGMRKVWGGRIFFCDEAFLWFLAAFGLLVSLFWSCHADVLLNKSNVEFILCQNAHLSRAYLFRNILMAHLHLLCCFDVWNESCFM